VNVATITLGDIDPDTPTRRHQRIRPLADYIADKLNWDRSRVKVRIAQSIDEISIMLIEGRVDVFLDSSYPSLLVRRGTGSRVILESLVKGERQYHTLIITRAGSEVNTLGDLVGSTLALQERYSTSGYLLPAAHLTGEGYELEFLSGATSLPAPDHIGFFFSGDEENTLAMIRKGIIDVGALSSQDYEQLAEEVKQEFIVLAMTPRVPRKLASTRPGLDEGLSIQLVKILLEITDIDRSIMAENGGWNWEFISLDQLSETGIAEMEYMMEQTKTLVTD